MLHKNDKSLKRSFRLAEGPHQPIFWSCFGKHKIIRKCYFLKQKPNMCSVFTLSESHWCSTSIWRYKIECNIPSASVGTNKKQQLKIWWNSSSWPHSWPKYSFRVYFEWSIFYVTESSLHKSIHPKFWVREIINRYIFTSHLHWLQHVIVHNTLNV